MVKLLLTISLISISTISYAVTVKPTPSVTQQDINNDVSAMIDAQNQANYDEAQQKLKDNQSQSSEYSNCPNCPQD
jgi:hypothetical protein